MRPEPEIELLGLIQSSEACRERKVGAHLGDNFGVVIIWEGTNVGVWGWIDGALRFRTLANWEPHTTAADPRTALVATMKMAEARNWLQ